MQAALAAAEDSLAPAGNSGGSSAVRKKLGQGRAKDEGAVLVSGQVVVVTAAVGKGEAEKIVRKRKEQEMESKAEDRRNLYLLEVSRAIVRMHVFYGKKECVCSLGTPVPTMVTCHTVRLPLCAD